MTGVLRVGHVIRETSIDRCYADSYRVEAIGGDWVVLRCDRYKPHVHLYTGDPEDLLRYVDRWVVADG